MKLNSKIWLIGAVALGLAACSDDEYTGEPQVIPQPTVLPADCLSATNVYAPGAPLDINAERNDLTKAMPMLNVTRLDEQPQGYGLVVHMIMAKSVADLDNPAERLDIVMDNLDPQNGALKTFGLSGTALNVAFHKLYGLSDASQPLAIRYDAYSVKDETSALLGTAGTTGAVTFKPVQYDYEIENSYYIISEDDPSIKYEMKNSGKTGWEDPAFSAVFQVGMDGLSWKVVPASMLNSPVAAECFGPAKDADTTADKGNLALGGDYGFISPVAPAPYMISVNLGNPNADYSALAPTFKVQLAYEAIYILGNAQGGDANPAVLTTKDYVTYGGFVAYSGWGCKMTDKPNWEGNQFANFVFDGPDASGTYTGTVGSGSKDGNILGLPDGIYAWVYNVTTGNVQATPIEYFELIGTATGGWNDGDVQKLAPATDAADCSVYTADINFVSTGEFKLRGVQPKKGNAWAFSLGGELNDLVWDGANSNFTGTAGVHKLTVNFNVAKEGDYASAPRVHYVIE